MKRILAALTMCLAGFAQAQGYPGDKVVKILVPFAAGSVTDTLARQVANGLQRRMKGTFIVENRPGANGIIATEAVAKAPADGYTLLVGTTSTHSQNPWMVKNVPYHPIKDFTPVAGIGGFPMLVVVPAGLPVRNMVEFVQYVKARPGSLSYGAPNGTSQVCAELMKNKLGIDLVRANYKSGPQAIGDLAAGHLTMICSDYFAAISLVQSGKLKALAITGNSRASALPGVPAMKEVVKGFEELRTWAGVLAPKGTPPAIAEQLARNILAITVEREFVDRFANMSFAPTAVGLEQFGDFLQTQLTTWGEWAKEAGIEPE